MFNKLVYDFYRSVSGCVAYNYILSLLGLDTVDELKGLVEKAKMEMILDGRKEITYKDFLEIL